MFYICTKFCENICNDFKAIETTSLQSTVNPLYNDIRYNSIIRYNVNSVCTKISGEAILTNTQNV